MSNRNQEICKYISTCNSLTYGGNLVDLSVFVVIIISMEGHSHVQIESKNFLIFAHVHVSLSSVYVLFRFSTLLEPTFLT